MHQILKIYLRLDAIFFFISEANTCIDYSVYEIIFIALYEKNE